MKKLIVLLVIGLIIGGLVWIDHENPLTYEITTVKAEVSDKHQGLKLVGKVLQTTHEVTVKIK